MAGVPPSVGFIGKELLYTVGSAPDTVAWLPWAVFFAAAPIATIAMVLASRPFSGPRPDYRKAAREGHWALWCGPVVLGAVGLYWGLAPEFPFMRLLVPAEAAVIGHSLQVEEAPWHSTGEAFVLTLVTLAAAVLGFWKRGAVMQALAGLGRRAPLSGDRAYDAVMNGLAAVAAWQTRRLQSGVQRNYLLIVFATLGLSLAVTFRIKDVAVRPVELASTTVLDWSLAALIVAACVVIIRSRSRLLGICALGVVGLSTALIFLAFGAPDVAMTQLVVETLVTVIVAIVLLKLPNFRNEIWPSKPARLRNGIVAVTVGVSVTLVLLAVTGSPPQPDLREYFERTAVPGGQGRNIVNVILVDFRALDTLGEISVLAIAGAAVFALLMPGARLREGVPPPDTGGNGGGRRGVARQHHEHHDPAGNHSPPGPVDSRGLRVPAAAGPRAPRRGLRRRAGRVDRVQPVRFRLRPAGGSRDTARGPPGNRRRGAGRSHRVRPRGIDPRHRPVPYRPMGNPRGAEDRHAGDVRRRRLPRCRRSRADLRPRHQGAVAGVRGRHGKPLMEPIVAVIVGVLMAATVYLMLSRNFVRFIFGLALLSHAANLVIFASGGMTRARPPLIAPGASAPLPDISNAVPQALILTAIVISFSLLTFALVLAFRTYQELETVDTDRMRAAEPTSADADAGQRAVG